MENDDEESIEIRARVTGMTQGSLVVRVGPKRRILDCGPELFEHLSCDFTRERTLVVKGETIIECRD